MFYELSNNLEQLNISNDLEIDRNTVGKYACIIRHSMVFYFEEHKTKLGGLDINGNMKVVELDESFFLKRKYNSGVIWDGVWYVGGVERDSQKCFIVPVVNRNAETMRSIIEENVFENIRID